MKNIMCSLFVFVFFNNAGFGKSDSLNALDVLNAYQKAIEKSSLLHVEKSAYKGYVRLEHISSTFITPTNIQQDKYTSETNYIFLYDHGLVDYHQTMKIFEGDQISYETKGQYLLDNEAGYQYGTRLNIPPPYIDVFNSDRWEHAIWKLGPEGVIFEGYFDGDSLTPIWEVLKGKSDLRLRDEMEVIDGHETYVLEAKVPNRGEYSLWIDPNYGFNLRRCVVRRSNNDIFNGKPLNTPPKQPPSPEYGPVQYPIIERIVTLDSVRIDNLSGNFIPVEGTTTIYMKKSNGNESTAKYVFKRSEIDLNPDFEKFENAFVLDVPNGTRVRFRDQLNTGVRHVWYDGKIVPYVDDLVIEELDKVTEQIIKDGDVPLKLSTTEKSTDQENESNAVENTQANDTELHPKILSETGFSPIAIFIPIGLLIIAVIGWKVFVRTKT